MPSQLSPGVVQLNVQQRATCPQLSLMSASSSSGGHTVDLLVSERRLLRQTGHQRPGPGGHAGLPAAATNLPVLRDRGTAGDSTVFFK